MEGIVKFFRDTLSGFPYLVYALIVLFFIFAIIGYFVSEKYMAGAPAKKAVSKKQQSKEKKDEGKKEKEAIIPATSVQPKQTVVSTAASNPSPQSVPKTAPKVVVQTPIPEQVPAVASIAPASQVVASSIPEVTSQPVTTPTNNVTS